MLIKKLSQGEIAVKNDGTLEELREVIKAAFPKDETVPKGEEPHYARFAQINWAGKTYTDLPIHSVKELYAELHPETEWQPKWGEKVEVSNGYGNWHTRVFVATNPVDSYHKHITINAENGSINHWCHIRSIQTLSLTLEEIAKKFGVQKVEIVKSKND